MKRVNIKIVLVMSRTRYSQDDIPIPDGSYFGQTSPGTMDLALE